MQQPEPSKEISILRKKRKKSSYTKINNETRLKLLEMVYVQNQHLKEAARVLGVNYSTAKTILRVFRVEKRIEKKNAEEERNLKALLVKFNHSPSKDNSTSHSELSMNVICHEQSDLEIVASAEPKDSKRMPQALHKSIQLILKLYYDSYLQLKENSRVLHLITEYLQSISVLPFVYRNRPEGS